MSIRRRYLVSYDITADKPRARVFKTLMGEGDHVQYSVFLCELTDRELIVLKSKLDATIHQREDQVLFVDLGPAHRPTDRILTTLGRAYAPPVRVVVI